MPPRKRPREVVDLTGDDNPVPRAKHPRGTASASQSSRVPSYARPTQSSQGSSYAIGYSQPSSSVAPGQRFASQQLNDPFGEDEPEILDLTQADDGPTLELYGTHDNKIVGCRYYNGIVSPGEVVVLRREPSNQQVFLNALRSSNIAIRLVSTALLHFVYLTTT